MDIYYKDVKKSKNSVSDIWLCDSVLPARRSSHVYFMSHGQTLPEWDYFRYVATSHWGMMRTSSKWQNYASTHEEVDCDLQLTSTLYVEAACSRWWAHRCDSMFATLWGQ